MSQHTHSQLQLPKQGETMALDEAAPEMEPATESAEGPPDTEESGQKTGWVDFFKRLYG